MSEYYTVITQKGLEVLTECIENGTTFPASIMKVGDSNGSYYEPSDTQTALKNTKYTGELYAKGKKSGYLYFDLQLPPSEGDYYIREVGLSDNNDNLLAVAKYPESYKQKSDDGSSKSLLIELQILLSNEAINTIVIDDSANLATLEELENYQKLDEKGEKEGYTPLDSNSLIPAKYLPAPVYNVFCVNTGEVDTSGKPAFLSLTDNVLTTSGSFDVTTANGNTYTVTDTLTLDISDYEDGDYNVYVNPVDLTISIKSHTLTADKAFPDDAETGDYLLNTSQIPYDLQQLTDDGTEKGLNEVLAGTLTISSGTGSLSLENYNNNLISQNVLQNTEENYLPLTGGTLTGKLYVDKGDNNDYKTINIIGNQFSIDTTEAPSSEIRNGGLSVLDTDGNVIMCIYNYLNAVNQMAVGMNVRRKIDDTVYTSYLRCYVGADGTLCAKCPTYTDYTDSSTNIATTAFLKNVLKGSGYGMATYSKASNGYIKFANGIIIQWGRATVNRNATTAVTLPTAFSSTNYNVTTTWRASTNLDDNCNAYDYTTTGFTLYGTNLGANDSWSSLSVAWQAIGY